MNIDEKIAQERVKRACDLLRSAYRLHPLDPAETLASVQTAISEGAQQSAEDIAEAVRR